MRISRSLSTIARWSRCVSLRFALAFGAVAAAASPVAASQAWAANGGVRPIVIDGYVAKWARDDNRLLSLACPSANECVALDSGGAVRFNPQRPISRMRVPIGPRRSPGDIATFLLDTSGVSCPSGTACVVVSPHPTTGVFDPWRRARVPLKAQNNGGTNVALDGVDTLQCPGSRECVVVDGVYAVAFDPHHLAHFVLTKLPGIPLLGTPPAVPHILSCPTTSQCTTMIATRFDVVLSEFVTFDPRTGQLGGTIPLGIRGDSLLTEQIACPAATECVGLSNGHEATFDPQSSAAPEVRRLRGLGTTWDLACPSILQCTAISGADGRFYTFDPKDAHRLKVVALDHPSPGWGIVQCPAATQCTAINVATGPSTLAGTEVTFDPRGTHRVRR